MAVDWMLYALRVSQPVLLLSPSRANPWTVTTPPASGLYEVCVPTTVPSNILAYVAVLGQVFQPSGATTARFDDGFLIAGTHFFHPDHLSTRVLTSSNGSVLGQQAHFPFGESWYAQNTTTNWQFTSYQRDNESNNDYALMRSYVNRLARFSSPDPAGLAAVDPSNPQFWNRYAYVTNNPLGSIDPLGLDGCPTQLFDAARHAGRQARSGRTSGYGPRAADDCTGGGGGGGGDGDGGSIDGGGGGIDGGGSTGPGATDPPLDPIYGGAYTPLPGLTVHGIRTTARSLEPGF